MRDLFDDIFLKQSKWIRVYVGKETDEDPVEHNVSVSHNTHVPIRAIIEDLNASQSVWKMNGVQSSKSKDVLVEEKYRALLEQSTKIVYNGDTYQGWRDNNKLQLREVPGTGGNKYLRLYMYQKSV